MFIFDNIGQYPCRLLHFHASPICLIVQAQPKLADGARLRSPQADVAESDLTQLYRRNPVRRDNYPALEVAPASYFDVLNSQQQHTHPSSHVLSTNPSSPPSLQPSASAPSMGHGFSLHPEVSGLTPSSSASTVDANLHPKGVGFAPSSSTTTLDASEDTGVDPDL